MHALNKNDSTSDVSYGERMFSKALTNYSKQQELCSFTRFETQCWTPEALLKTPQKCVFGVFLNHTRIALVCEN